MPFGSGYRDVESGGTFTHRHAAKESKLDDLGLSWERCFQPLQGFLDFQEVALDRAGRQLPHFYGQSPKMSSPFECDLATVVIDDDSSHRFRTRGEERGSIGPQG